MFFGPVHQSDAYILSILTRVGTEVNRQLGSNGSFCPFTLLNHDSAIFLSGCFRVCRLSLSVLVCTS